MRQRPALIVTGLVAAAGLALLGPPALLPGSAAAALAPMHSGLHLASARAEMQQAAPRIEPAATAHAIRAIAAMPLNQGALSLAIETGATADPVAALNLAAALGWRDPLVNARLAGLAMETGAISIAAQRIDALGRTMGGQRAAAAADLLMARAGGPRALADRAAHRVGGQWWLVYLALPARSPGAMAGRMVFARALDADDGPWRQEVLVAVTHGLARSAIEETDRKAFARQLQALRQ